MISAYTHGMGANLPGQSPRKCGHASQVASCGSHSAGIRNLESCTVEDSAMTQSISLLVIGP